MSGLIPVRSGTASPYSLSVNRYFVSDQYATALYIGDPVVMDGTNSETAGKYPTVERATLAAGNLVLGAIVGFEPVSPELNTGNPLETVYRPAGTNAYVLVADDPNQEFIVGEDGAGAAIVTGDIGNKGILIDGAGGSTVYGNANVVLDSSSFDSGTATGQYVLLGLLDRVDQSLGGSGAKFRVRISHAYHQLTTPGTAVS